MARRIVIPSTPTIRPTARTERRLLAATLLRLAIGLLGLILWAAWLL